MKIFASDLDGTLFFRKDEKDYCKESDLKAIQLFQQEGNQFGCCTGRPCIFALDSLDKVLNCDFYIVSSGGLILNKDKEIIKEYPIPFDCLKQLINHFKDEYLIYIHTLGNVYTYDEGHPLEYVKRIKDIDELKDIKIYSVSIIDRGSSDLNEADQYIKEHFNNISGFVNLDAIDIALKGCSKGNAIKQLKEYYQADISYGIGDSYNDIPLLDESDISFTFHRCKEEVKNHATYLVEDIKEAIELI